MLLCLVIKKSQNQPGLRHLLTENNVTWIPKMKCCLFIFERQQTLLASLYQLLSVLCSPDIFFSHAYVYSRCWSWRSAGSGDALWRSRAECEPEPEVSPSVSRAGLQHRGAAWGWWFSGAVPWTATCWEVPADTHEHCECLNLHSFMLFVRLSYGVQAYRALHWCNDKLSGKVLKMVAGHQLDLTKGSIVH